jgi:dihydroorotate dehydrogenase
MKLAAGCPGMNAEALRKAGKAAFAASLTTGHRTPPPVPATHF